MTNRTSRPLELSCELFLALLCDTAQQNYCHDLIGHSSSVDIAFSETVKWIDTKVWWQVPIHPTYSSDLFSLFKIIFLIIFSGLVLLSYCRDAGVRGPSVRKTHFLRTRQAAYCAKVPLHHISIPLFFIFVGLFFKILHFWFIRFP